MRIAFLGPDGTFSAQAAAARRWRRDDDVLVPEATLHDAVIAVQDDRVDLAVVPIENSIEGSVNESLDALLHHASDVRIVGESVLTVSYCLIVRPGVALSDVQVVLSHPQALAQCARTLRGCAPGAALRPAPSTADAVREVCAASEPWAALGTPRAAQLYGGEVVRSGLADDPSNTTRFVTLERSGMSITVDLGPWKSTIAFAGTGDGTSGWLVDCLAEFSSRDVNLTRIESRPARGKLGHYVFLVDIAGQADQPGAAADAVAALAAHCTDVRVLGAYPAAAT